MAINRSQLAKELEPGLNALFGMEYLDTKQNIQKFLIQKVLIERLKKKL